MMNEESESICYYQTKIKEYVNDVLGKEGNRNMWVRFCYPSMDCYGIDRDLTLLKTIGAETKVDECESVSLLGEVYKMFKYKYYRIVEEWRLEIDRRFFRRGNYNIYTPSELIHKCEGKGKETIKGAFMDIFESLPNDYIINYSWFNHNHGVINTPIMIWKDSVRVYIRSGVDTYKIFEWFKENKDKTPFSTIEDIVHDDYDNPGYITFTLRDDIIQVLLNVGYSGFFVFPVKVDKLG